MKSLFLIFSLGFQTLFSLGFAQNTLGFEDHAFPELVTSARALALGNAYLNKVDGPWAVFYNPAGLGTIRKFRIHLLNFHLEGNNDFFDLTGGNIEQIPDNIQEVLTADGLRERMQDNPGAFAHARANFFPSISFRHFTLGYFYSRRTRAYLEETNISPELFLADRRDHGPVAGFNYSFWGGILKLGLSAAYLSRSEIDSRFAADEDLQHESLDYRKGRGLILTGGTRLTLPFEGLPTISAVWRNAGGTEFKNGTETPPQEIEQTIDLGASITPILGKKFRIHMEVNYRDLSNQYQSDSKRRLGAGIEFDFARTFFFRLGFGDGFGSGGIGVQTKKVIFDLSTYAVDTTSDEFRGKEDRRFALSLSTGF